MRKTIALFGCLAILATPFVAHAQASGSAYGSPGANFSNNGVAVVPGSNTASPSRSNYNQTLYNAAGYNGNGVPTTTQATDYNTANGGNTGGKPAYNPAYNSSNGNGGGAGGYSGQ